MTIVLWNVDTQDWRRPGVDAISQHLLSHAEPGRIVLMHDGGGDRSQTIAALKVALPKLQEQGYAFRNIFLP
jgi:peptidoglycan/xylan/chitin deacetylase (PgdA/CDA1 family)